MADLSPLFSRLTRLLRNFGTRTGTRRRRCRTPFAPVSAEVLENRVLLAGTSGVYDENVIAVNTVDFVATGSTVTNTDFATSVAADYQNNHGGVIDATVLAAREYDYGVNLSKTLLVTRADGTNYGIGNTVTSPNSISGTGAFVSTRNANVTDEFNFTSFDLSIQDGVANEHVIEIGVTVLSFTGRDYGTVTVTGRLAGGSTLAATRHINEATALGDTFYGLTAPEGDYFTGFSIGYDGVIDDQLWFDDIGFRTSGRVANAPPVARNDFLVPVEDTLFVIQSPGILANDTDSNGDSLTVELVSGPTRGTLNLQDDGSFTYTPTANLHGIDTFTYRALDGNGGVSNGATVTLRVLPVNDAPQLDDTIFSIPENSPAGTSVGTVTATDVEQNPLTYAITGGNSSGAFAINSATGEITVADATPLDFETSPQFSLTVQVTETTGGALSDTATVTINLTDVREVSHVDIDVDSGDDTNTIDLKRDKKIAVAILSTSSLNAPLDVDLNSLTFGRIGDEDSVVRHRKRGTIKFEVEDVNGDGLLDLVVYFETTKTGFEVGDTESTLKGQLLDGTLIEGTASVDVKASTKGGRGRGNRK